MESSLSTHKGTLISLRLQFVLIGFVRYPCVRRSPMMSDVERHASEAGLDRLLRHTAGIVNGVRIVGTIPATGKPADEEQPGTGCFVRWGNHHLIVTARHVVENARIEDLRVFAYPSGGFKVTVVLGKTSRF
jgi:hypothetical protein